MPIYLGKEVSDVYLQGLIVAFREGQKSIGVEVEEGDQVVIDRLTAANVIAPYALSAFALGAENKSGGA